MKFLSLLLTLCLSATVLADLPSLKVVGPTEAEPGQLVVLTAESDGANFVWIPDASLGQVLQCSPKQIGMATPKLGVHKIIVVASNDKGEMVYVTHAVNIKSLTPPPTDPIDPVVPPPSTNYADFKEVSKKAVSTLKDNPTAFQLKNALNRLYPDLLKLQDVMEAKVLVTRTVESVLLLRTGSSKDADWLGQWRVPLNELHLKYNFKSVQQYADAIKATAEGLEVTTNTTPDCVECTQLNNKSAIPPSRQIIFKP